MKPKILPFILLSTALAACGAPESAEPANEAEAAAAASGSKNAQTAANAADSIRTRQQHYKEIGRAMKSINDELKKSSPDVAVIQAGAATIDRFAPQIQGWFPDGSGAGAGVETEARAEIWSRPEEFRRATERLMAEASRFNAVAASGDLPAIRDGLKTLGGACKNCHDQFRAEKD